MINSSVLPKGEDPLHSNWIERLKSFNRNKPADAPVGSYNGTPITKGSGRFLTFIKWMTMDINVPRRYNFQPLTQEEMNELIVAKR